VYHYQHLLEGERGFEGQGEQWEQQEAWA
jgi:hypothetical protein